MHKISYKKDWDKEGFCYAQCITVTKEEWNKAIKHIEKRANETSDLMEKCYLRYPIEQRSNIFFTRNSQTLCIAHFLNLFNEKRFRFGVNTRFKII